MGRVWLLVCWVKHQTSNLIQIKIDQVTFTICLLETDRTCWWSQLSQTSNLIMNLILSQLSWCHVKLNVWHGPYFTLHDCTSWFQFWLRRYIKHLIEYFIMYSTFLIFIFKCFILHQFLPPSWGFEIWFNKDIFFFSCFNLFFYKNNCYRIFIFIFKCTLLLYYFALLVHL